MHTVSYACPASLVPPPSLFTNTNATKTAIQRQQVHPPHLPHGDPRRHEPSAAGRRPRTPRIRGVYTAVCRLRGVRQSAACMRETFFALSSIL